MMSQSSMGPFSWGILTVRRSSSRCPPLAQHALLKAFSAIFPLYFATSHATNLNSVAGTQATLSNS